MQTTPPSNPSAGKVYEMQWDCKFCGTTKLLGKTHRFCPNCGAQQDSTWRYFPSDAEKVAVQDHVYVGADRICPACNSLNSGKSEFCGNCGAGLTEAAQAKEGATRTRDEDAGAFQAENLRERQEQAQYPQAAAAAQAKPQGKANITCFIVMLVVVGIVAAGIFILTRTREASAYVTGFEWERTVQIERLSPISGSSICDRMPITAYNVSRNYEQVGSQRVPDGQECSVAQVDQGDGTFREERRCETTYRDEPVYGYVCYYTVNSWVNSRVARADGDKDTEPFWPRTGVTSNCLTLGCERESNRSEAYVLEFRGDGNRTFTCPVSYALWDETGMERSFTLEIGAALGNIVCSSLEPVQ
jgi:hypothetical protein